MEIEAQAPPRAAASVESLASLGMSPALRGSVERALVRRGALLVVTGAAGSGVNATIDALNACAPHAGVRGIADRDGADAATAAAERGETVLAAMRLPDAVSAILALRRFRTDSFRLVSTLQLVIAQRRARRLCRNCRRPIQAHGSMAALLGFDTGAIVHAAEGCDGCGYTGYVGEIGVFEAVEIDSDMRRLVFDGGDAAILARHAFVHAPNFGAAARALVREGLTTPAEAVRISRM